MVKLSPADYAVIALFFVAVIALGFSAKLKENTSVQLVAAGRRLTLPLFLATLVTTWYGGVLATGQLFHDYGMSNFTINAVPYWVFGIAFAIFMARNVRKEEQISIPERLERCFGRPVGVIGAFLVMLLATPAAYILMLGTLLSVITNQPLALCIAVGGVVGTLFLYRGGLLADARSNTLSFVLMYAGFILLLGSAIAKFGAPGKLIAALPTSHRAWDGLQGAPWVLSWFLVGSWTFIDPGFHQRVASAGDERLARRGVFLAVAFWIVFDTLTTLTAAYAYFSLDMKGNENLGLQLFPVFGSKILPAGVRGIFFAGMAGAILSAIVGYTFVSGSTIGRDLLSKTFTDSTERTKTKLTRLGTAIATIIGIALAIWSQNIVNLWYDLPSILIPGLIVPVVGAYVERLRPRNFVAVACMLAGSGSALIWYVAGKQGQLGKAAAITPILAGLVVACGIWGIGFANHGGNKWKTK